ncbi:putative 7-carboxy-7-deazaguanine synthase QueE [Crassaminicella thermophila]|uniref:7-carboxy-7-deazaguanine synthase n=1 Tax=Crassaminicella thermophila TaxID=2599308 RepID=A0A5C0SG37_CRATE|nr:putative 7-carboxy-7-deazaguanine synthase QueE [Crassaminicella thermophila]QEK13453.1 putative 7-carboxy-7-deazaguanine synthase QueE [Crassaminicella thermophila]
MMYKVVEKFVSINGEGRLSGQLAVFIRFLGCNLDCSYCDTKWANKENTSYTLMSEEEIYEYIKGTKVKNVTLTGGEPLLQENIIQLIEYLSKDNELSIEIETNGSVSLKEFTKIKNRPRFTMDYKLPSSGMEYKMLIDNFSYLKKEDTVKFVAGSMHDLERAKDIIDKYELKNRASVYVSPVFGKIDVKGMVEFMKEHKMNDVTLQLQLHKIIWDPEKKGV